MASPTSSVSSASSVESTTSLEAARHRPLTLEDLVTHFVASKRSLNTQTVLWRANEIVNTTRELLEENAVLAAKNTAIHNIVDAQVDTLQVVRHGIDTVEKEVATEFKQLLHHVDTSFAALNATLNLLRQTPIEAVLQPPATPQKHLFDFIDSTTVTALETNLRACIDRYNDSRAALDNSTDAFDTALDNLDSSIDNVPITPATPDKPSPIPRLYRHLEEHAKEAAQLFESLVQHYDLCVTALRHTEGGSAAATQATSDLPTESATENDFATPPEPMTDEERQEMLSVLSNDAHEVDDVVAEIRDRGQEMTAILNSVEDHIHLLRNEALAWKSILEILTRISSDVKQHIATSRAFHASWLEDTQPTLLSGIEEWETQRDFYERFDLAYAELLVEIAARRRRYEKAKMKADEAQRELDRLHEEDFKARERFTLQQGDFLPLDIWKGLGDGPRRWVVEAVGKERGEDDRAERNDGDGEEDEEGDVLAESIPILAKGVVERAASRVKGKGKGKRNM